MEKSINLKHGDKTMVRPSRKEILDFKDYGDRDFLMACEKFGPPMSVYVSDRYSEYKRLGFPDWKRTNLRGMSIPPMVSRFPRKSTDPYLKSMNWLSSDEVELLDSLDFEGSDRKLLLLGDIFFDSGVILSIPDGSVMKKPFLVGRSDSVEQISNNLFIAGEDSEIQIVIDSKASRNWFLQNNRFLLKRGSKVDVLFVNHLGSEGFGFVNNFYRLEEGAVLKVFEVSPFSGTMVSYHLGLSAGKNSSMDFEPLFLAAGNTNLDLQFITRIMAENCNGQINGTGIAIDNGSVIFRGNVDMRRGAKNSTGSEHSSVTILSDGARADAIPCLLVDENEVNASHAATIGSLDEERIFYLMSRGMTRERALKMIVRGTFEPVIERMELLFPENCGGLRNALDRRVGR